MREMKDSGVEWIGEIPKEWSVIKNKYLISMLYSGGTPSATNGNFYCQEVGIPFVSISDMSNCSYVVTTAKHITESGIEDKKLRILPIGTILYSIYATVGAISELKVEATISQAMLAIQLNSKIDKSFYKYNLTAMRDYIFSNASGNTQFNLSAEKVRNFYFVLPTFSDQHRIADYLDDKCGKIDRYIEQQKQVIEKLKAYKQSVITEAVTKGLDPTVPMKDSGVEWIGEIPEGWEVTKIKKYCKLKTGTTPSTSNTDWFDGDFQWFTPGDFRENYILDKSSRCLSERAKEDGVAVMVPHNTVLIVGIGATAGKIGYTTIDCSFNQQITAISSKNVLSKYLMYWMIANTKFLRDTALFTTLPILNNQTIGDYILIFPRDHKEQELIVQYLDNLCISIDSSIKEKQTLLEKLTEYKKSLIYEVVTGKKEV